jgi:hypothetical protein
LLEGFFQQRSQALSVKENAKNERLAAGARIGDSRPYAEADGNCGLEGESEAARAR